MKNMKLNWGFGAFALYGSFVLFMLFMVFKTSKEKVELVTEDYYEKDMVYQQRIDKLNRTKALNEKITWQIIDNNLMIKMPGNATQNVKGDLIFFRPSDESMDLVVPIKLNENNAQLIELSKFSKGMYKVKVDWTSNDLSYYAEEIVIIP